MNCGLFFIPKKNPIEIFHQTFQSAMTNEKVSIQRVSFNSGKCKIIFKIGVLYCIKCVRKNFIFSHEKSTLLGNLIESLVDDWDFIDLFYSEKKKTKYGLFLKRLHQLNSDNFGKVNFEAYFFLLLFCESRVPLSYSIFYNISHTIKYESCGIIVSIITWVGVPFWIDFLNPKSLVMKPSHLLDIVLGYMFRRLMWHIFCMICRAES